MDAQGYDYDQIIRRVKTQFPQLKHIAITVDMAHQRLVTLDYRLDIDYFKLGLKKAKKASKEAKVEPSWLRQRRAKERHKGKGKGKGKANRAAPETASSAAERPDSSVDTPALKHEESIAEVKSSDGTHSQTFAESSANAKVLRSISPVDIDQPVPGEDEAVEKSGSRHGRLIHDRERETEADTVPTMSNKISKINGTKGRGIELGKLVHHDRTQSNVSSTFTGTTAVITSSIEETIQAPEGLVYTRPATPTGSEVSTTKVRPPELPSPPKNSSSNSPSNESEGQASRAARLGRAIHSTPGRVQIPISQGKLHLETGIKRGDTHQDERHTARPSTATETYAHTGRSEVTGLPRETPENTNKDDTSSSLKENHAASVRALPQSLENGEPGPSTIIPKPLSVRRPVTTSNSKQNPRKERVIITEPEPEDQPTKIRNSHDTITPKVRNKKIRSATHYF